MPATSVAAVAPQARSLSQVSPSSGKTPSFSGMQPTQISQAFIQSCDHFSPKLRAKFIAQEQDRLQQDALQQTASFDRKRGALEKRSRYNLARLIFFALPPAAPPLSTIPRPAATFSTPCQNILVPVRVLPPRPLVEYQPLAVRKQSVVLPASVESLILAPSDPQIANCVRKRKHLTQAERLAQPSHSDVQAAKCQRAAEALIAVLPHELLLAFFGGEDALSQVADLGMRKEALMKTCLEQEPQTIRR
eukprot:2645855-Pleurochrysis_carterae.AAC.1